MESAGVWKRHVNALTREALEQLSVGGCQVPDCTHEDHDGRFYFHARCHPQAHAEVSYTAGTGVILIACAKCKRPITAVAVASANLAHLSQTRERA